MLKRAGKKSVFWVSVEMNMNDLNHLQNILSKNFIPSWNDANLWTCWIFPPTATSCQTVGFWCNLFQNQPKRIWTGLKIGETQQEISINETKWNKHEHLSSKANLALPVPPHLQKLCCFNSTLYSSWRLQAIHAWSTRSTLHTGCRQKLDQKKSTSTKFMLFYIHHL